MNITVDKLRKIIIEEVERAEKLDEATSTMEFPKTSGPRMDLGSIEQPVEQDSPEYKDFQTLTNMRAGAESKNIEDPYYQGFLDSVSMAAWNLMNYLSAVDKSKEEV
tara:strand:+ start:598 stop:918 length:321 start_codon:yes stop_codon:yes gene_type:complete